MCHFSSQVKVVFVLELLMHWTIVNQAKAVLSFIDVLYYLIKNFGIWIGKNSHMSEIGRCLSVRKFIEKIYHLERFFWVFSICFFNFIQETLSVEFPSFTDKIFLLWETWLQNQRKNPLTLDSLIGFCLQKCKLKSSWSTKFGSNLEIDLYLVKFL